MKNNGKRNGRQGILLLLAAALVAAAVILASGYALAQAGAAVARPVRAPRPAPATPLEMALRLERELARGAGMLMPDPERRVRLGGGLIPLDGNSSGFPADFLDGLVPETRNGVEVWRAVLHADDAGGDMLFHNADGRHFWTVPATGGTWSADWIARLHSPDGTAADFLTTAQRYQELLTRPSRVTVPDKVLRRAAWQETRQFFLPSHVEMEFIFIPEDDLGAYRSAAAAARAQTTTPPQRSPAALTGLSLTGIACGTNGVTLSAAWPPYMPITGDALDIFFSQSLRPQAWTNLWQAGVESLAGEVDITIPGSDLPPAPEALPAACFTNTAPSAYAPGVTHTNIVCTNAVWQSVAGFFRLADLADSDGDGLTDAAEIWTHGTCPYRADTDGDGLDDGAEITLGTSPLNPDTDGDGLVDGSDPDPLAATTLADADGDGIPDAYEIWRFGGTNAVNSLLADVTTNGFLLATEIAAGLDPNRMPAPLSIHSGSLASRQLCTPFSVDGTTAYAGVTNLLYERTFRIGRDGGWQQYFISASPDGPAGWSLEGMTLEWQDSGGGSGSATASPMGDSLRLAVSTNSPAELTLRLRRTASFAGCAQTLHLLSWVPGITLSGGIHAVTNGVDCTVVNVGSYDGATLSVTLDRSQRPCLTAPDSAELASTVNPFAAWSGRIGYTAAYGADGAATGGTLTIRTTGCHHLPQAVPPAQSSGGSVMMPASVLLSIWPELTWGSGLHDWGGCERIYYDPVTGEYSGTFEYPLDSGCLWRNWWRDETGGCTCTCEPRVDLGNPELDEWFQTSFHYHESDHVEATVTLGDTSVWSDEEWHNPDTGWSCAEKGVELLSSDPCDDCDGCENGNCDGLEGPQTGSLAFRIPLGTPRREQVSGFLWFRTGEPLTVTPAVFSLLARPGAAIMVESNNTGRTLSRVLCSDERGRDLRLTPISNGVRITVSKAAGTVLEHTWHITNESGSRNRIRLRKISRQDNLMSDHTYVCAGGAWTCTDNISGITETVTRTGDLNDPDFFTLTEERVVRDAAGTVLAHTITESYRHGHGRNAVLREGYRLEKTHGQDGYWKSATAGYWHDPSNPRRNGRPKLVRGDDRPWSYQTWDGRGREILRLDQWDGSACPVEFHSDTPYTLAEITAMGIACTATETDYAAHPGDANHRDDRNRPRTVTTYHVRGGTAVVIARVWHIYSRGTTGGLPNVTRRTIRAHAADAAIGDPRNAVSTERSYDTEAPGLPLLLRGSPLYSTGEDGIITRYRHDYGIFEPATRTFTVSAGGPHLRTISMRQTAAFGDIPGKSVKQFTIRDATHGTTLHTATVAILPDGAQSGAFDWQTHTYDDKNRLRCTVYSDGSSMTNAYSCCRLLWTQDRNGYKTLRSAETGTDHLYHATEEVSLAQLPGVGYGHRTTMHFMDALGRETNTVVTAVGEPGSAATPGCPTLEAPVCETTAYPDGVSGHAVRTDRRGVRTVTTSTPYPDREVTATRTFAPDNPGVCVMAATNIAYRNGRSIAIRAWDGGWTRETSWTDYAADGTRRAFSVTESSDSPGAVTNRVSYSDFLGRTVAVLTPGAGGAMLVTTNIYDGATPRLIRTETTGQPATTYLHDALGNTVASVRSGITSATETRHEIIGGNVWRVDTGSTSCGGVTNAVSTTRRQLTGLSDALRSQTVSIAPNGSATTEQSSFDPQTCELTTMRATDAATPYITVSRFGRHIRRESPRETVFNYFDQMGRAAYSEACHPATGEPLYWRWSQFDGSGNEVNYGTDYFDHDPYEYLAVTGARTFDAFNRETSRTDALGNTVTTAYDALGRPVAATGATYPVGYEYDTAGRMTAMSTTRDGTSWDATYWNYDHATGLATGKTYADGSAVSYAYTPDGKPLRTTWARDAWKENAYSTTGLLTGVSYSDDTPVVSLGYDAFQHLASASNAVVAYAYMNSALGTATNETVTFGGTVSTLARGMDYRHRLASLCVGNTSPVQYWYDVENRLSTVSTPAFEAEYAYTLDGWDSGHSITLPNGTLLTRSVSRNPYRRQLINSITNSVNGAAVNPLAYNYDKLSRVTSRNSGTFDYNDRSEITNAIMGASLYAFLYDAIGNRISSSVSAPLRKTFYTANQLNQYTEIRGAETNSPAYDADGNLLTNGVWSYAWDAENRLIAAYSNTVCVVSNAYDHLSRRVIKITTTQATYFVWDNWNIVAEIAVDRQTGATNLTRYAWGLDISGTLQGAGGIGGLLAVQMDDAWYFPFYDNNGNITDYVNAAGMIVAHYEYSPFGEIVAQSGTLADTFAFRFSTKYQDSETGLVMYQLRPYSPLLGRWLCHDPIREEGGENIYCFVSNDPLSFADPFGLWSLKRLNTMSDYYATILDADFRSLRDVVMPDIQAEIDRVLARAEALPKQCQYRAALIEGLERVKRTLDKIDLLLKSGQPLNLGLKGYYGSPGPDPWSARVWKSWGIWEMEFNLGDGLYFPKDYKYRLGTLLHEHVHIVEGNNQHKGFWNNPYVIDTMVKNSFESFSTDVRSKMIVEEGDKCCPKGHEEWPNNP